MTAVSAIGTIWAIIIIGPRAAVIAISVKSVAAAATVGALRIDLTVVENTYDEKE